MTAMLTPEEAQAAWRAAFDDYQSDGWCAHAVAKAQHERDVAIVRRLRDFYHDRIVADGSGYEADDRGAVSALNEALEAMACAPPDGGEGTT